MSVKITWLDEECEVLIEVYRNNGRKGISLFTVRDEEMDTGGEDWLTATKNLPCPMADDEVAIDDYSIGNEGILSALINLGVIAPPHRMVDGGWVQFPICKLLYTPEGMPGSN